MSTLVRESILADRAAALAAISGVKSYRNLTSIPDEADFPAAAMFDGDDRLIDGALGANNMELDFDVEIWAKAGTETALGAAFSDLLRKVSAKMFEDPTCGGYAIRLFYAGVTGVRTDKTEGANPMMAVRYQ